jgi:outer membrane protein assembly factor BamB
MIVTGLQRITLFTALAFATNPGSGAPWRAAEQPELKQALEGASILQTESLGEPARGVNVWERWMVPNLDGKTWDLLQIYFKEYYGPTWLYAVDLGTGEVKKLRLPDGHQFYLSGRALGFDGKYYIATPSRKTWSMDLFVYDPATNTIEERGEIVHGLGGEVRPLAVGPDGRIYGTGTRGNQIGLYIYDPKLRKAVKDFGAIGPKHPNGAWSRYLMGVDDTHAYIASGMIPAWYLVAVNLENGEEKVLLESPTERVMDIIERFPSAYVRVPQDGGSNKEYWLYHGEAIPKVNDNPPWPKQDSPWAKAVAKPEVYFDQTDPDENGQAVVWYRPRPDAAQPDRSSSRRQKAQSKSEIRDPKSEIDQSMLTSAPTNHSWKSIRLEGVNTYPHRINPLSLLPKGLLYGTGEDYVGTFLFDPKADETIYCGPRVGLAPYTTIVYEGKLYLSGYSGGHLFVYDPARPWTLGKGGPPGSAAPDQVDARSNPRYLGDFDRRTRVGLMQSSALGADGRIYFGGFGLRHYTGGGFGWFDPKTGKLDGFWRALSGYAVHEIAPALDGQLIVISTARAADELNNNQKPEEAKLFVYDVSAQKITREIVPLAKARTTGLIIEVTHQRLLGLTVTGAESGKPGSGLLYGVDVTTGEVLFQKLLPWPVSTDNYWPHWVDPSYEYLGLVRGPDGFIWTYLKNVLVRIDPKDASVHVVGRIEPVGHPTFVGHDIYLSGPEQLRRIRNIARTSSNK